MVSICIMPSKKLEFYQIRLAETIQNSIVILFAYDFENNHGICGSLDVKEQEIHFDTVNIPMKDLKIFDMHKMKDILSDENDPTTNIRSGIGYLMQIGVEDRYWNEKWGTFDWNSVKKDGKVNVLRQIITNTKT